MQSRRGTTAPEQRKEHCPRQKSRADVEAGGDGGQSGSSFRFGMTSVCPAHSGVPFPVLVTELLQGFATRQRDLRHDLLA
eukprot:3013105-Rhodomonas_salina.2